MPRSHLTIAFLAVTLAFSQWFFAIDNGDDSSRFESLGPYGGDVRSLLIDWSRPSGAYLGSSNGKIYKSGDGGLSWTLLKPGIGRNGYVVDTLIQHPHVADRIFAGGWDLHSDGGGLFESRDAGLSWDRMSLPEDSSAVRGFAICRSDPDRMVAATLTGVFVSENGGSDWRQVGGDTLLKAESVAMDPEDCGILYVGTWRLGYRSRNFGETWEQLHSGMPLDSDIFSVTLDPGNPEIVYAGACSGVYRSGNRASAWKRLRLIPERLSIRAHVMIVDPVRTRRIYAGTTEGLFVSDNDGANWRRITSKNISVNAVAIDPSDNSKLLVGTEYRGVLRSEDGGRSWRESNEGFVQQNISWIVPEYNQPGSYVMGLHSGEGGLLRFDKTTGKWQRSGVEAGTRVFSYFVLPDGQGRLVGTSQGIYRQASESGEWKKLEGLISDRTVYRIQTDAADRFVFAATDRGIYRASIETLKFRMPPGSIMSPKVWCILAPESDPDILYAGTSLGLLRSWDKGTTWNVISAAGLPARVTIRMLAVSPEENKHLFAATAAGLYESLNGGVHWKKTGKTGLSMDVSSIMFLGGSGQEILAADKTSGGVFLSKDGGQDWSKVFSPGHDSPVNCMIQDTLQPGSILLGTQSDGLYLLRLD